VLEFARNYGMGITPEQCRAARALLKMKQTELAKAAGVGVSTVTNFELGTKPVSPEMVRAMRLALENRGIVFGNGGAHFSKRRPK
jgi:transcriptional regulator with XRE-family HTH domain